MAVQKQAYIYSQQLPLYSLPVYPHAKHEPLKSWQKLTQLIVKKRNKLPVKTFQRNNTFKLTDTRAPTEPSRHASANFMPSRTHRRNESMQNRTDEYGQLLSMFVCFCPEILVSICICVVPKAKTEKPKSQNASLIGPWCECVGDVSWQCKTGFGQKRPMNHGQALKTK